MKVLDHLRRQGLHKTIANGAGEARGRAAAWLFMLGYRNPGRRWGEGSAARLRGGVRWRRDRESCRDRACAQESGRAGAGEVRSQVGRLSYGCLAIAMQGVRRADPRLGEHVAVIGLGLIGQIALQLLRAAGCRVIGLDLQSSAGRPGRTTGRRVRLQSGQGGRDQ